MAAVSGSILLILPASQHDATALPFPPLMPTWLCLCLLGGVHCWQHAVTSQARRMDAQKYIRPRSVGCVVEPCPWNNHSSLGPSAHRGKNILQHNQSRGFTHQLLFLPGRNSPGLCSSSFCSKERLLKCCSNGGRPPSTRDVSEVRYGRQRDSRA